MNSVTDVIGVVFRGTQQRRGLQADLTIPAIDPVCACVVNVDGVSLGRGCVTLCNNLRG